MNTPETGEFVDFIKVHMFNKARTPAGATDIINIRYRTHSALAMYGYVLLRMDMQHEFSYI